MFHRRRGVTDGQALVQILPEERFNAAEPLILRGVDQLMGNEGAIGPAVSPDKNPVAQSETARRGSKKMNRSGCGLESKIRGRGHPGEREKSHPLRRNHTDRAGIRCPLF